MDQFGNEHQPDQFCRNINYTSLAMNPNWTSLQETSTTIIITTTPLLQATSTRPVLHDHQLHQFCNEHQLDQCARHINYDHYYYYISLARNINSTSVQGNQITIIVATRVHYTISRANGFRSKSKRANAYDLKEDELRPYF